MIIDNYKRSFLNVQNVYFASDIIDSKADIVRYFQCKKSLKKDSQDFTTLILDLTLSLKDIKKGFRKSTRSYINQAVKKYKVRTDFFIEPDKKYISDFCSFYNEVAKIKKIPKADQAKIERLKKYIFISKAFTNTKTLVWHLYLFDKERVRLLYSCILQDKTNNLKVEASRANKLLHIDDISFAKSRGYKVFDFGGVSLVDKNIAGIDHFKLGFTKQIETTHHFVIGGTKLGRMVLFLDKIKNYIYKYFRN